jgi:sugar lactone lactonase YvrE
LITLLPSIHAENELYKNFSFILIVFLFSFIIAIDHNRVDVTSKLNATIVAGGNGPGKATDQLARPCGLFVDDDDQTIVIADCANDRIVQWKIGDRNGKIVAGGKGYGSRLDQVELPTAVIIDKDSDSLIISEGGIGRIVRWARRSGTKHGEILIDKIQAFGLTMVHG